MYHDSHSGVRRAVQLLLFSRLQLVWCTMILMLVHRVVQLVWCTMICFAPVQFDQYDSDSGVSCGPVVCLVLQLVWCSMLLVLVLLVNRVV